MKVAILGAGGHARETAEILLHAASDGQEIDVLGYIEESRGSHGEMRSGLRVLGGWEWFDDPYRGDVRVLCAVGDPTLRRSLVERARALGLRFATAVSPLASISRHASIGEGAIVFPLASVGPEVTIGEHATLNVGCSVSHDTRVGPFTTINPGARLAGNVVIGEGCAIGMGAQVIQKVRIGDGTVVGAGAVVIHDLPAGVTAVGVPTRVVGERGR